MKIEKKDIIIIIILFALTLLSRLIFLDHVQANYDEGVYLYSAKLISEGLTPYKDFFVAHPPLYLYLLSLVFKFGGGLIAARVFHVVLTSLAVIFIYLLAKKIFRERYYAVVTVLMLSLSPLLFFQTRRVMLDSFLVLLVALAMYFYFEREKKPYGLFLSGVILGLAAGVKLAAVVIFLGLLIAMFIAHPKLRAYFKEIKFFVMGFCLTFFIWFLPFMLVPSFFSDVVSFQTLREFMPLVERVDDLNLSAFDLVFIFESLFLSLIYLFSKNRLMKIFAFVSLFSGLVVFFALKSFYIHYLLIFFPFIIFIFVQGVKGLLDKISEWKILVKTWLLMFIFLTSLPYLLIYYSIDNSRQEKIIERLGVLEEPIYIADLDLAIAAEKEVTPWYYMVDSYAAKEMGIGPEDWDNTMAESKSILLNKWSRKWLPLDTQEYIEEEFNEIYSGNGVWIYISKDKEVI